MNNTVAVPGPEAPAVIVSQLSLLTALQSHDSADGVTVVDVVAPLPATVSLVEESV